MVHIQARRNIWAMQKHSFPTYKRNEILRPILRINHLPIIVDQYPQKTPRRTTTNHHESSKNIMNITNHY